MQPVSHLQWIESLYHECFVEVLRKRVELWQLWHTAISRHHHCTSSNQEQQLFISNSGQSGCLKLSEIESRAVWLSEAVSVGCSEHLFFSGGFFLWFLLLHGLRFSGVSLRCDLRALDIVLVVIFWRVLYRDPLNGSRWCVCSASLIAQRDIR